MAFCFGILSTTGKSELTGLAVQRADICFLDRIFLTCSHLSSKDLEDAFFWNSAFICRDRP